jgi:ElaB/YqjD/DUF883 family membrane-anchored ribosome-binding protein
LKFCIEKLGEITMKTDVDKGIRSVKDQAVEFGKNISASLSDSDKQNGNSNQERSTRDLMNDIDVLKNAFADLAADVRNVSSKFAGDAADKVTKKMSDNSSAISASVTKTANSFADSTAEVAHNISVKAGQAANSLADAGESFSRQANDLSKQAVSGAKSVSAELEAFTQRSPTLALACAVGVGLLLGNLARTRS